MATKKRRKPQYPIHKMGKHCGYEEYEDGSIKPAPMYLKQIEEALESEAAMHAFIESFTKQMYKLFKPIHAQKARFWESIRNDYGLDEDNFVYSYHRDTQKISKEPIKKEVESE